MLAGLENEWQQLVVLAALFIGFSHPKVYKMMNDIKLLFQKCGINKITIRKHKDLWYQNFLQ